MKAGKRDMYMYIKMVNIDYKITSRMCKAFHAVTPFVLTITLIRRS